MRRVVITGYGLASPIGNTPTAAMAAMRHGQSGIRAQPTFAECGMLSQVAGIPPNTDIAQPPRKMRRFMADAAWYGWHAALQAIDMAQLDTVTLSHPRTGLIVGSGVGSVQQTMQAAKLLDQRGIAKLTPFIVPQVMGNTVAANLATALAIHGVCYGITSACATSAHAIGHAYELIQFGKQDVLLCGGAEEVSWHSAVLFDVMGVLSSGHNDNPQRASRPYHRKRDGFVIAGGAGILVLESLEHALARKAPVIAEVIGYGATSDGADMVAPSGEGAVRSMRLALDQAGVTIDYVNTHATGTQSGDLVEVVAMQKLFTEGLPAFSSTKGLTGHAIAAAGALEMSYSLLMMQHQILIASAGADDPDPALAGLPLVTTTRAAKLNSVLCNSFGFGGSNASLVLSTEKL